MFEISASHIADLTDTDLRALVGMLCEAELRKIGLPTSAVTWGGHQDAPDGGVDVRVDLPQGTVLTGFVPRPQVVYQVKNQDMPPSGILKEMRPEGVIRPSIQELADQSGSYIIVSSKDSTSDTALKDRREAMSNAVSSICNENQLHVDFYDSNRIATWVRNYFALIPWVLQRAGTPIPGWQSYGPWAHPAEGIDGEYLADDDARIQTGKKEDAEGVSVIEGIEQIRASLREPRSVVRLVGMSGVGKTRLVQSLFDIRIGKQALDPALAIYTNISDYPDPSPVNLASYLANSGIRAIMVVDNCQPDVHRRLSEVCRATQSQLSIITIEYDIRDDGPEGTEVFKLEAASLPLIEKVIQLQYPDISSVNRRKMAEFSDGNARIAIALAASVEKSETIAGLSDEELLSRLFRQRHEHDQGLLAAAQVCSLVYSFNGEQLTGSEAELPRLGVLISKTAQDVFGSISELSRRNLVQKRGCWRAVLPQAIANRLAMTALENIPLTIIEQQLVVGHSRLLKSFSKRLGYLHNSPEAVKISTAWLQSGGFLSNVWEFTELHRTVFTNITPATPEAALSALERALIERNGSPVKELTHYVSLLHSLAYDRSLFERAALTIAAIAEANKDQTSYKRMSDIFASLFFLYFSGTHASLEERLRFIEKLLKSGESAKQDLALKALSAALEAAHFTPASMFDFGARSRDFGYWPRDYAEVKSWFATVLKVVESLVITNGPIVEKVLEILAEQLRGIWNTGMHEELERLCSLISQRSYWSDGWIAVRETLQYDYKGIQSDIATRLIALDRALQPKNLSESVRAAVLASGSMLLEMGNWDSDSTPEPIAIYEHGELIAFELGKEVAINEAVLNEILPELVKHHERERLWSFGRGLATSDNPRNIWNMLTKQFSLTSIDHQSPRVLGGFLHALGEINEHSTASFLDEAVEHETLGDYFPILQSAVRADAAAVHRLKRALELNKAPVQRFRPLCSGRWSDPLSGSDLSNLLLSIAKKDGGFDVAFEILSMRLYSDTAQKHDHIPEIIDVGRQLLTLSIEVAHRAQDHHLGAVVEACLPGPDGPRITIEICKKLKAAITAGKIYGFYRADLLRALLKVHPIAVLDAFLGRDEHEGLLGLQIMRNIDAAHKGSALANVPENVILAWCNREPNVRFHLIAEVVDIFQQEKPGIAHWSMIAARLLDDAPEPVKVLQRFIDRLSPHSWSGSRAAIVEARIELVGQLKMHTDPDVRNYAANEYRRLKLAVEEEKQAERTKYSAADQRFEW